MGPIVWNGETLNSGLDSCNFESLVTTQVQEIRVTPLPVRDFPILDLFAKENRTFRSAIRYFPDAETAQKKYEDLAALKGQTDTLTIDQGNPDEVNILNIMLNDVTDPRYRRSLSGIYCSFVCVWQNVGAAP